MAKGVFITKVNPSYDDLPESRYHFPNQYLGKAEQTLNDWILYYESRRDRGRQVYFATARVAAIEPDPKLAGHYYAIVRDYMEFPSPVPYRIGNQYFESRLQKSDGSANRGLFGRAVHLLKEEEYLAVVQMGMAKPLAEVQNSEDGQPEPASATDRRIIQRIISQPVRDMAFQEVVRSAYDATCAMTGLKLVNGGGKCEIEAAHIKPVGDLGPDSPRNGLALSRTFHWMFDRGILSMEDDGKILTAGKLVTEPVRRMMNPDGYVRMPVNRILRPHPQFLRYHREHVFKG